MVCRRMHSPVRKSPSPPKRSGALRSSAIILLTVISLVNCYSLQVAAGTFKTRGATPRLVQCYSCVWYPNSTLPSARNAPEVCRPHGFRLPMVVESCELGCVVSIVYTTDEYKNKLGIRLANKKTTPKSRGSVPASKISVKQSNSTAPRVMSIRRDANSTYKLNITLPPMEFFQRGCAKAYNTGCIMDLSRPGVYHEDCFCHKDMCNGILLNDGMVLALSWVSLILRFMLSLFFSFMGIMMLLEIED